jgi:hypothetical protein
MTTPTQRLPAAHLRPGQVIRERGISSAMVDRVSVNRDSTVSLLVGARVLVLPGCRRVGVGHLDTASFIASSEQSLQIKPLPHGVDA